MTYSSGATRCGFLQTPPSPSLRFLERRVAQIEYHLVEFRHGAKLTRISLTAPEVLAALELENKTKHLCGRAWCLHCASTVRSVHSCLASQRSDVLSSWHPEYGSWMVEATPGAPYEGDTSDLLLVETNMAAR